MDFHKKMGQFFCLTTVRIKQVINALLKIIFHILPHPTNPDIKRLLIAI